MIATKDTLLYELTSPNNKYKIEVVSSDEGALGGITKVKLDNIYWNTFKKERTIYLDYLGRINSINWTDDDHININGAIIDINSKMLINKLKSDF